MDTEEIRESTIVVGGEPARVFTGGQGEPLLLVHGGWGGAQLHWAAVWKELAQRFSVIAPDLPGLGQTERRPLGSVGAYARWVDALLDTLHVPSAWCVGNSFGASVVCRLAGDFPARCRGLVLVNGIPMPRSPRALRWLGERRLGHRLLRAVERSVAFSPEALKRGFVRSAHVRPELRALVRSPAPPQLDAFVDILVRGGSPRPSGVAPLLLWGADDRLLGTSARAAEKLHASWPGSTLTFVPGAGHLPQVENPGAFVTGLTSFVEGHSADARLT